MWEAYQVLLFAEITYPYTWLCTLSHYDEIVVTNLIIKFTCAIINATVYS